jgi:predicted MFS family arabinose efflux permease
VPRPADARADIAPEATAGRRLAGIPVVLGLAMGPAVGLGLGRFAYALLLPPMRSSLHWSLTTAGAINTANAAGYLAGAVSAVPLARRLGTRRVFLAGLVVTAVSLLATAASGDTAVLAVLRLLAGAAAGVSFVAGAGLAAELGSGDSPRRATWLLGAYFAGGGAGIVVSGIALPPLLAATTAADGWRWGWVLLAALSVAALVASVPAVLACREPPAPPAASRRWPVRRLTAVMTSYALFGVGYIAYMTFIVAFLVSHGARTGEVTAFWVVLGAAAIAGGFAWPPLIARLRGGRGVAAVLGVVAAGVLLPLLSGSPAAALASAVLFGASFLAVVMATTSVARRSLDQHHWTPAIGTLTVAFAAGQCFGPVLAGTLSDGPSGLRIGLTLSAGVLAAGALIALAQPHPALARPHPAP